MNTGETRRKQLGDSDTFADNVIERPEQVAASVTAVATLAVGMATSATDLHARKGVR